MHQSQLQAYLHLIQQLLACPSGEEWIVLRQNEGLVTPDLVQVMEQVATQLDRQGNPKEAKFLHNLAGQIHHLFLAQTHPTPTPASEDRQQAYLQVIRELLECPQGQEGQVLGQYQDLLGPGLVRAMQQVANQLATNGDTQAAEYLHHWAQELARLWLEQQDFQAPVKPTPAPPPEAPVVLESMPPLPSPVVPPPPPTTAPGSTPVAMAPPSDLKTDLWATVAEPASPPPALASPAPSSDWLASHLQELTTTLTQLNQTLQAQTRANPLWYMEVLEQACNGGWLLTSDEVQQLIGVKPSCPRGSDRFQRGSWVFLKAGKLGSQTAWQVEKHA